MLRPSVPYIIHVESFDKVGEVLNAIHHVKCTYWDLHVLAVLWAYRTMCKTLTEWEIPKLKYEVDAIIPMEHAKPRLVHSSTRRYDGSRSPERRDHTAARNKMHGT